MTESRFEETPSRPEPTPRSERPGVRPDGAPAREPVFNAPWQAVAVVVLIMGGYALQTRFPPDAIANAYAFSPANLAPGRWETIVTSIFLHGSWSHAMMNAAFGLAFSAPLARLFGAKLEGGLLFFSFYLLTGVIANLGFAAVHPGGAMSVVGASGAVSGLMGAASRLMGGFRRPGPMFSRNVLAMAAGWAVINGLMAVFGGAFMPGAGSAGVAWEAHIAGFIAGVLLIGVFARFAPQD